MAGTSDLHKGVVIQFKNDFFIVTEAFFVSPGKGSAFTRVKMKSLTNGKNVEQTYKSNETVDIVEVQNQRFQYLYKSGDKYAFMNQTTYETIEIGADILGDSAKFLLESMEVRAVLFQENVVAVELPVKMKYKVTDAPPAVKGDTASSGRLMKDLTLENGLVVRGPIFIKPGEMVLINTETGEYCERVND